MPTILFATNRTPGDPGPDGVPTFDNTALDPTPGNLICGVAQVDGTDPENENSGTITAISELNHGAFSPTALAPILASANNILVFVQGTDNSFADSVTRAAYNCAWLAQGNEAAGNVGIDVILFTWPTRSYGSGIDPFTDYDDYRADQQQAALTPYAFHLFIDQLRLLQAQIGKRKLHMLCHSMGNYMLGYAVDQLFANDAQPALPRFEEIILAAADEDYRSLHMPGGGRLSNLWRLGREISVYYSRDDLLLQLSQTEVLNGVQRLGYDGPPDKPDLPVFPTNVYEFIDCTGCNDYISGGLLVTHQYYRESPTVRADIVATLAGVTPKRLGYDANGNFYSLFPPQMVASADRPGPNGD
jgi:esterase/lipase superfamily enzyme